MSEFLSGKTATTQIGYTNDKGQRCHGHRGVDGTDHGQRAYKMECLLCSHDYGANGTDIFQRRCPNCQGGAAGLDY